MSTLICNLLEKHASSWFESFSNPEEKATCECLDVISILVVLCFLLSVFSGNYSQVDKLWSITPVLYSFIFLVNAGDDARTLLMFSLTAVWGARLTLNFYRKGGYTWPIWQGEEDYRWSYVRSYVKANEHPVLWQTFNLVFICIIQHVLLFMLAFPIYYSVKHKGQKLDDIDAIIALSMLSLIVLEGISDEQQWDFQHTKYKLKNAGMKLTGEYKDGFLQSGLFSLCRHPNFACEQAIWITFAMFGLKLSSGWFALAGAGSLVTLFAGSTILTEHITAQKYPEYKRYQKTHFMFLPFGQVA